MDANSALWILSTIAQGFIVLLGVAATLVIFAVGATKNRSRDFLIARMSKTFFLVVLVTHLTTTFYCLMAMTQVSALPRAALNTTVWVGIVLAIAAIAALTSLSVITISASASKEKQSRNLTRRGRKSGASVRRV